MKEIRVAIIGTGIIAHHHMWQYKEIPGVKVVAACDINRPKMEEFCKQYGIEKLFDDYRELLKCKELELDAVDVCLHNNLHAPITIDVLKSGLNCYTEKPMAGSYKDALAMYNAAKETGKMLHIQLAFIYMNTTHAAKNIIDAGLLGKIYHARSYGYRRKGRPFVDGYAEKEFNSQYWAGGGALYDMGVYHISQLLYLLDCPEIKKISGSIYQELDMDEQKRAESGFDVEELGVGFVKFANDLSMDILESWAIHAKEFPPSMIAGAKGGLSLGEDLEYLSDVLDLSATAKIEFNDATMKLNKINESAAKYSSSQVHWVNALRGECNLLNTAKIALDTMLISEGIFLSHKLGREVSAEEVQEMSVSKALTKQETHFGVIEYEKIV